MGSCHTRASNGRRDAGSIPKGWAIDRTGTAGARSGGGGCPVEDDRRLEMLSPHLQKPQPFRQGTGVTRAAAWGRELKEILFKISV